MNIKISNLQSSPLNNSCSRSNGLPNRIHVSSECRAALEAMGGYVLESRGLVEMKGMGEMVGARQSFLTLFKHVNSNLARSQVHL